MQACALSNWRYHSLTSTSPYRFRITGRTKHHINVFGEELVIENAETALADVCKAIKQQ